MSSRSENSSGEHQDSASVPAMSSSQRGLSRRSLLALGAIGAVGVAGCSTSATSSPSSIASSASSGSPELMPTKAWAVKSADRAPEKLIEGYPGQLSVNAGEVVDLHVSTQSKRYSAEVFRIGDYEGKGGARVAALGPFPGQKHGPANEDSQTRSTAAYWPVSGQIDTTGWDPGFYLVHLIAEGKRSDFPIIVKSENAQGKIAYVSTATTWQAYNKWGGRSLYMGPNGTFDTRAYEVSLDRPLHQSGRTKIKGFELPIVRVAEESGAPMAWFSNIDVDLNPSLLDGALGVVTAGHDEYWSVNYRDALASARDSGSNLGIMGANTGYWRVRIKDSETGPGRRVVCYKSASLDPLKGSRETTSLWRDGPHPQPETTVVGMLYDAFPVYAPMEIRDPDFWMYRDTGVKRGTKLAGMLGPETDRLYPLESTPRPIQVAALSDAQCRGSKTWATMTYYTAKSGAGVLATGTMAWTRALPMPSSLPGIPASSSRFAKQATLNMFNEFAQGPMAPRHPARDDFDEVSLPSHNTSGAA